MTALLAQIFPVILLALGVESGKVNVGIRRRSWWTAVLGLSVAFSMYGFGFAIVSTYLGGAGPIPTVIMFTLLVLSLAGLVFVLLALLATDQVAAEFESNEPSDEAELLDWLRSRAGQA